MKTKVMLLTLLFVFMFSCDKQENVTIKGELYFKLISYSNLSNLSDEKIKKFDKQIDSIYNLTGSKKDEKIIKDLKKIKDLKLLKNPSASIILNDKKIITVYFSESEYKKIEKYTIDYLKKFNKKISLEIQAEKLDSDLYFSNKIVNVKELKGTTKWEK